MSNIFRLQKNVPDIYIKGSRDFQLMCNVFDIMNSGVKYDIDSMTEILNTSTCRDSMLPILQTKLGFINDRPLTNTEIRHVLTAFKRLVKDKGSQIGIKEAIEIYLKLLNTHGGYQIIIKNVVNDENLSCRVYEIHLNIETSPGNINVLREMLKYVLPTGYKLNFGFYSATNFQEKLSLKGDSINIYIFNDSDDRYVHNTVLSYNSNLMSIDPMSKSESEVAYDKQISTTHSVHSTIKSIEEGE